MNVSRMSDEELKGLARDCVTNRVYLLVVNHENQAAISDSFGAILAFLDDETYADVKEHACAVYAKMEDALPMAVNGQPMFLSVAFLHRDDYPKWREHIDAMLAALN